MQAHSLTIDLSFNVFAAAVSASGKVMYLQWFAFVL
jgi:hypothetical protein